MAKTPKRSSIEIFKIKDEANRTLEKSVDDYRQGREAIALFLETLLMDAGEYRGFRQLEGEDKSRRYYY